jgi:alkylation response protein AidB-like acyl-CoA dehydrogenase
MPVLSDQERMIEESVADLLDRRGGAAGLRRKAAPGELDRELWTEAAAAGWTGMLVPEAAGGSGSDIRDALVMLRGIGRAATAQPFSAVTAAACVLARYAPRCPLSGRIASGESVVVPLLAETVVGAPGALSGRSLVGSDIAAASAYLLVCSTEIGTRLILVDREAPGLSVQSRITQDGGSIGTIGLHNVSGRIVADETAAVQAAGTLIHLLRLCRAAELVGLADEVLTITLDYLRSRRQFRAPLASFQALQHRAASVHVSIAAADALLFEAARAFHSGRQGFAAVAAFSRASAAAFGACKEAVQMHGAIGLTDEYRVGLFLKRAMALAAAEGGAHEVARAAAELARDDLMPDRWKPASGHRPTKPRNTVRVP